MKIAIIDDEFNVRELLKNLISLLFEDTEIVGEAASVIEAKKMLSTCNPDIVLLDVELEDGTGFNLLDQLNTINFKAIFITAFNQHAIKAFKYNAADYLLKPILPDELKKTITKVIEKVFKEDELDRLLIALRKANNFDVEKIVVSTLKEKHVIVINDIIYCKSEGAYTQIVTKSATILSSKNLKFYQEQFNQSGFIRTHQSFLVNKKSVVNVKNSTLSLVGNVEIPISFRKKVEIKNLLLKKD